MRRSSLDQLDIAISREVQSKYDNIQEVADNMETITTVADNLPELGTLADDIDQAETDIAAIEVIIAAGGLQGDQGVQGNTGATGVGGGAGIQGSAGLDGASIDRIARHSTTHWAGHFSQPGQTDTYSVMGIDPQTEEEEIISFFSVTNGQDGDMAASTYDTNSNGIVDNSEKVGGKTLAIIESERASEITAAGLALGTNYSVANHTAKNALTALTVPDKVFVTDDGDGKWAQYIVTAITDGDGDTSTYEVIMDEDIYLNANTAASIKTTYESNTDTNAFTNAEQTKVGHIAVTQAVDLDDLETRRLQRYDTGIITGGTPALNTDTTKIDIAAVTYLIQGIRYTYAGITALAPSFGVGETARHIGLGVSGLVEQSNGFTNEQKQTILPICRVQVVQGQSGPGSTLLTPLHIHFNIGESGYLQRIWHEEAIGALYYSGGIISENATPLQIDESAGIFYNAQRERLVVSGTSGIQAKKVYQVATAWVVGTATTLVVDTAQYNNGTDLTNISNNKWVSHTLLKGPKEDDQFFFVYSEAEYGSQAEAEAAPTSYGVFQNQAASNLFDVAKIVVQEGATNIDQIVDKRPFIGGNVGTTLGTSNLQQTYDNSADPEILTDTVRGALTVKRGTAADTDNILEGLNGAGTPIFAVQGDGEVDVKDITPSDTLNTTATKVVTAINEVHDEIDAHLTDSTAAHLASVIGITKIGSATYDSVQQVHDTFHSSGVVDGGIINDAGSGNITVNSGSGYIRPTNSDVSVLYAFDWAALGSTTIPLDTSRYVGIEYNAGSPQAVVRTSYNWNFNTDFPLGTVNNEDGTLHIISAPHDMGDHASLMIQRLNQTMGIRRDDGTGGLILGETGTRNITMSAGALWQGLKRFPVSAVNTSGADRFDAYYGSFTKVAAQSQWDNTQYDNAGSLATLSSNKYGVHWFYMELDGEVIALYGTAQYNSSSAAEASSPPASLPGRLTDHAVLIAQLVFKKDETAALEINSAFASTFSAQAAADHINLSNIGTKTHAELEAEKANLASPTFTGIPAAPTPAVDTNTTQIATTAFVNDVKDIAQNASFKNLLINGNCRISQRGDYTSATTATTANYYLDRWEALFSVVTGVTVQQTSTPARPTKLKMAVGASGGGTGTLGSRQTIEEFTRYKSKQVTFSALVQSDNANARVFIEDSLGYVSSSAHTGGESEELLTVTHTIDVTTTFLKVYVGIGTSSNGAVAIANSDYIEFTQAQLEVGSVATDFEMRPYGVELDLCQRYCESFPDYDFAASGLGIVGFGFAYTTTGAAISIPMKTKRDISSLSLTVTNPTNYKLIDQVNPSTAVTAMTIWAETTAKHLVVTVTVASGLTQYRNYMLTGNGTDGDSNIVIEAEL